MKIVIYATTIIGVFVVIGGIVLAVLSHQSPDLGLVNGHFTPCPTAPNCVSSETDPADAIHYIAPIKANHPQTWHMLTAAIEHMGGVIVTNNGNYLHATFTSLLMHYIDDVEARTGLENNTIYWRSSSRVGHSDFGTNRKRINQLRQTMLSP